MTALAADSDTPARRQRRVPWSPCAWGDLLYLAGAIPVQLIALGIAMIPWWPGVSPHHAGNLLLLILLSLILLFLAVPLLTRIERHRLRTTAGIEIPPQPRQDWQSMRGIAATVRSRAVWRQLGYHLLIAPAIAGAAIAAIGVWVLGILYAFCLAYGWLLPSNRFLARGAYPAPADHMVRVLGLQLDVYVTLGGFAALAAAPWATAAVRTLDASMARALLGASRAEELQHRVEHLTQTRAGVVDAADAERRRLERDLHDGTQQRLVSLAMNLGMARAQAATTDEARQAIADAHEEAKAALAELRDLIRGLHPAVLEDRGLDAALSGVAARMPIPVRLTVDLPRRPPPVVEAVAYFVVSEGLANIAKHAEASQAEVFVQRAGDRLHIIISDDGVGGADPARGTGLTGLERRAASVDGTFEIFSPPGGPTLLTVDLPCLR
jgi:signal transduction histidine kinase